MIILDLVSKKLARESRPKNQFPRLNDVHDILLLLAMGGCPPQAETFSSHNHTPRVKSTSPMMESLCYHVGMKFSCAHYFEMLYLYCPPHLRLTTFKVMVIVWRLRGNIIRTVLYIANVLSLQWTQLTKTVHTARLGLEFVFLCCLGCMICLYVGVCFVLPWTVESFPSCCGAGVTNLNEPTSSFLLPPRHCLLGAGSIPLRATVNKKQCETRGLLMSLVIRY